MSLADRLAQRQAPAAVQHEQPGPKRHGARQADPFGAVKRSVHEALLEALGPTLYDAHLEMGIALDLKGDYAAAHEHFAQAIELAPTDSKAQALRSMAVSYAFEGNPYKAAEPEIEGPEIDLGGLIR